MIKYNYLIKRNEQDEIRQYTPALPMELDDLCLVEGPNASGKSTLLHIIALALYGKENTSVCKPLKQKMHRLLESEQEVTFDVLLKNKNSGVSIHAEKSSPDSPKIDLWEIENGSKHRLSSDLFHRKYNLIYDIPNDPTARLKDLKNDLQEKHHQVGRKLSSLRMSTRDLLTQIQNARDPNRLKTVEELISKSESELKNLEQSIAVDREFLNKFEKYAYSKLYSKYSQMEKSLSQQISDLEKKKKTVKKEKRSKDKEITRLKVEARAEALLIMNFRDEICHTVSQILGPSSQLETWSNLNIRECLFMPDPSSILSEGINHLKRLLHEERENLKLNKNLEQAKFYEELLFVLKGHSNLEINIPGMQSSVSDLINVLQTSLDEITPDKHKLESIDECIEKLNEMVQSYNHFVTVFFPRINEIVSHVSEDENDFANDLYEHEEMIADLKKRLEHHKKHLLKYRDRCIQAGLKEEVILTNLTLLEVDDEMKFYSGKSEESFLSRISLLESRFTEKAQKIKENEARLERLRIDHQEILSKKPHKFQNRKNELQILFGMIENLEKRIKITCIDRLKALNNITDSETLNSEEQSYYNQLAVYLGKKVGSVRHVDGEYEIEKIDLIRSLIHTKSGKEINLFDMGTGQSQGAYLQGILSSNDDRKVIALIDEIAMMDSKTISPVISRLKEMYKNGKLICGIIVQRAEELSARGLLEGVEYAE